MLRESLRETNIKPLINSIIFLAEDAEGATGNPSLRTLRLLCGLCVFFAVSAGNTGQTFARVQICTSGRVHVNVTRDHDNVHTRTFTHEQTRTRMNTWTF